MDLPNAENRVKILRVILSEEELVEGFDFIELARITEGYSGSDLKVVLCSTLAKWILMIIRLQLPYHVCSV